MALVVLTTAGCAVLSGATDLSVADDAGVTADSAAADAFDPPSSIGSSGSSPATLPDGSSDAGDAASLDGGADAPTTVRCNGVECRGQCCVTKTGIAECAPHGQSCPEVTVVLSCDERADCPSGQRCCLQFAGSAPLSACADSCPPGAETLCRTDDECSGVEDCVPMTEIGFPPMHGRGACE